MVTIDLITGFLGSGKTTFLRSYAGDLMKKGTNLAILESDHGAINVDALILQELEGELCDVEMIVGGDGAEAHRRRFRTKLISMGMLGYDRVLVEPSGVYDVDEFFDTLREEPLNRWYEIGSVITLLDGSMDFAALSAEASYMLASQAACSGKIVLTHMEEARVSADEILAVLNGALAAIKADRRLTREDLLAAPAEWSPEQMEEVSRCGHVLSAYEKQDAADGSAFQNLFYMNLTETPEELEEKIRRLFQEEACGQVRRVKGFFQEGDQWIEINASRENLHRREISNGQSVLIVIGERLNKAVIDELWPNAVTV